MITVAVSAGQDRTELLGDPAGRTDPGEGDGIAMEMGLVGVSARRRDAGQIDPPTSNLDSCSMITEPTIISVVPIRTVTVQTVIIQTMTIQTMIIQTVINSPLGLVEVRIRALIIQIAR